MPFIGASVPSIASPISPLTASYERPQTARSMALKYRSLSGRVVAYPMGLSASLISHKSGMNPDNRSPRGWNGLPTAGKELLEDGVILLHQLAQAEKFRSVFWTATIPTCYQDGSRLSEADHRQVLANWSEVVRQVFQELTRLYERKGLPKRFLYVVEPQEQRWHGEGILSLHIHAILVNRWNPNKRNPLKDKGFQKTGYWEVETEETDQILERVLSHLLGKAVDCRSACNLESIKGMSRLSFYVTKLGKIGRYISKGSKILEEVKSSKWANVLPSSWYGSDCQTRQEVRASVITIEVDASSLGEVRDQLQAVSDKFEVRHQRPLLRAPHLVTVENDGGETAVALVTNCNRLSDVPVLTEALLSLTGSVS